jgi:hypothetical protein
MEHPRAFTAGHHNRQCFADVVFRRYVLETAPLVTIWK